MDHFDIVVVGAGLAGALTALMILIFLGSWRSTLTVVISIPLSILFSISVLYALGFAALRVPLALTADRQKVNLETVE